MKDNNPPPPNLPVMSPQERRLWAASHNLPENMLLVSTGEMMAMREAFDACAREVEMWRKIGRIYLGAELPEVFEPALRGMLAEKERLEKEAKERKVPATVRPVEP